MRQWVEATSSGGRRVFLDDFVLPRREEAVDYTVEEVGDPPLADFDTKVRGAKTVVPVLGCCQEVAMWDAFAGLVAQGRDRERTYDAAMLRAHAILDAAMASSRAGGAAVPVGVG